MFIVYVIQSSKTHKYYIGYTSNLNKRLAAHNGNHTTSIKNQGPFVLVCTECYETREDAYKRERQIKRYKGGNAFKKLIEK